MGHKRRSTGTCNPSSNINFSNCSSGSLTTHQYCQRRRLWAKSALVFPFKKTDLLIGHWIEDFDRFQEGTSVISTAGIDFAPECGDSETATFAQHGNDLRPGVGDGIEGLHRVEDGEAVVSAQGVYLPVQLDHAYDVKKAHLLYKCRSTDLYYMIDRILCTPFMPRHSHVMPRYRKVNNARQDSFCPAWPSLACAQIQSGGSAAVEKTSSELGRRAGQVQFPIYPNIKICVQIIRLFGC